MIAKVVGIKNISFSNDKGQSVNGFNLYLEFNDPSVTGTCCDKKFFNSDMIENIDMPKQSEFVVGRDYDFVYQAYNFSGKASLVAVKPVGKDKTF